mmetsp:Transcript_31441/g.68533  ORF Transcript_31441/g.68533 Transcript_31441/m.68533 type:complete len:1075 (-) Transcript_31441:35-3259(-)
MLLVLQEDVVEGHARAGLRDLEGRVALQDASRLLRRLEDLLRPLHGRQLRLRLSAHGGQEAQDLAQEEGVHQRHGALGRQHRLAGEHENDGSAAHHAGRREHESLLSPGVGAEPRVVPRRRQVQEGREALRKPALLLEGADRRHAGEGLLEGGAQWALGHEPPAHGLAHGRALVVRDDPACGHEEGQHQHDVWHRQGDDETRDQRLGGHHEHSLALRAELDVQAHLVLPEAAQQAPRRRLVEERHGAAQDPRQHGVVDLRRRARCNCGRRHSRDEHPEQAENHEAAPDAEVEGAGLLQGVGLPEGEPEVADDVAQDGEDDEGRDGQADRDGADHAAVGPERLERDGPDLLLLVHRHPAVLARAPPRRGPWGRLVLALGNLAGRHGRELLQLLEGPGLVREHAVHSVLHDGAVLDDEDPIDARVAEHVQLGGGDDARRALEHPAEEALEDVLPHLHVQGGEGVVEQLHLGARVGRPCEAHARPLAAREGHALLADLGLVASGQQLQVEVQPGRAEGRLVAPLLHGEAEEDVLPQRAARDEGLLSRVGDPADPVQGGRRRRRLARGVRDDLGGHHLAQEGLQQRGLALSQVAHDEDELAPPHLQVHRLEGLRLAPPGEVALPDAHGQVLQHYLLACRRGVLKPRGQARLVEQARESRAGALEPCDHADEHAEEGEGHRDGAQDVDQREGVGDRGQAAAQSDVDREDRHQRERGKGRGDDADDILPVAEVSHGPLLVAPDPLERHLEELLPRAQLHHLHGLEHLVAHGEALPRHHLLLHELGHLQLPGHDEDGHDDHHPDQHEENLGAHEEQSQGDGARQLQGDHHARHQDEGHLDEPPGVGEPEGHQVAALVLIPGEGVQAVRLRVRLHREDVVDTHHGLAHDQRRVSQRDGVDDGQRPEPDGPGEGLVDGDAGVHHRQGDPPQHQGGGELCHDADGGDAHSLERLRPKDLPERRRHQAAFRAVFAELLREGLGPQLRRQHDGLPGPQRALPPQRHGRRDPEEEEQREGPTPEAMVELDLVRGQAQGLWLLRVLPLRLLAPAFEPLHGTSPSAGGDPTCRGRAAGGAAGKGWQGRT